MQSFFHGTVLGFSIAAPVGPIGLLCIRRAVTHGRMAGFVSGLGAAAADTLYGLVAALGLTAVTEFMLGHRLWFQGAGGVFLGCLGWRIMRGTATVMPAAAAPAPNLAAAFGSTFVLTVLNPMTIVAFLGAFAGLSMQADTARGAAFFLVAGVFTGSTLWWLILSQIAGGLRDRLRPALLHRINQAAGAVVVIFGLWLLATLRR